MMTALLISGAIYTDLWYACPLQYLVLHPTDALNQPNPEMMSVEILSRRCHRLRYSGDLPKTIVLVLIHRIYCNVVNFKFTGCVTTHFEKIRTLKKVR